MSSAALSRKCETAQLVNLERGLEAELAEQARPVVGLEGLAAHVLEVGGEVLEAGELRTQMVSYRTGRDLLEPVAPRSHEVVELPQPLPEGDPVVVGELVELGHVLLEERTRGHVRLDVSLDLLQAHELRRRDREVLAVVDQPRRRAVDLLELGVPLLDARDDLHHVRALGGVDLLRLELEPAGGELLHRALQLAHPPRHLAAQVRHLVLDALVEGVERQLELLPSARERRELRARLSAASTVLAHHARELLELLELELDLVLAAVYGGPLPLGRADLIHRLRPARQGLHARIQVLLDLLLARLGAALQPAEQCVAQSLVLVLQGGLQRREGDRQAVDLLEAGQLLLGRDRKSVV